MSRIACCLIAALASSAAVAQETLKPEDLARLKAATVFVKTGAPRSGAVATGSGFLVKVDGETGWIVTNHHVVDLFDGADDSKMLATPLEVVFDSGTDKERIIKTKIAAFDPVRDLATLKIENVKDLPAPIVIDEKLEARETMLVYVCGFPFGGRLAIGSRNPEITIGRASVSSLRRSVAGGPIATVQIDGALNPGNSGGPIVAVDGKLVGVAVRSIPGRQVGQAVPLHEVVSMLRGRLGTLQLLPKKPDEEPTGEFEAILKVNTIDPFGKIKAVFAHVLPGDKEIPKPTPGMPPSAIPNAMKVPLKVADGYATADVTVPATAKKSLVVQLELELTDGKVFTNAIPVTVGPVRPEIPGRANPSNRHGPQRTPEGNLKLASGTILPFPAIPTKFPEPKNSESVSTVNAGPEMFVGKTIRMDALSSCLVNPVDRGEYELAVETDSDNVPTDLRVVLPKDLALQIADLGIPDLLPAVAQIKYPIRLEGKVGKPVGREKRHSFAVESVDFLDEDGKAVTSFKAAGAPPAGKTTLSTLNRFPEKFVGQSIVVEGYVKGARYAGGTGLDLASENLAAPLNLEIYTSRSLAGQVESDIAKADLPARAKLTLEVKAIHGRSNKGVVGVKQVELLDDDDKSLKVLKATANVEYPNIPPPPKPSPPKTAVTPPDEATKTVEKSPSPKAERDGVNTTLVVAIVISSVLFLGGGYLLISALRKPKPTVEIETVSPEPKRKSYVAKAAKPEPEPKPVAKPPRTAKPAPPANDDNPFANFGK